MRYGYGYGYGYSYGYGSRTWLQDMLHSMTATSVTDISERLRPDPSTCTMPDLYGHGKGLAVLATLQ
jgi:hypothetical protein